MAKHKKPAPAAKKPAAKPVKPVKAAKKKSVPPVPAKKPVPAAKKPAEKTAAKPAAHKPAAKVEAPSVSKSRPPIPATAKTTPPVPSTSKSTPPMSAKHAPASKTTSPIPAKAAAAKAAPAAKAPVPAAPAVAKAAPAPAPKPAVAPAAKAAAPAAKTEKSDKAAGKIAAARELLRNRILGAKKASKPIAFTLEEIREIAKTAAPAPVATPEPRPVKPATAKTVLTPKPDLSKFEKPAAPSHVKAASLADILGFNPKKAQKAVVVIDPEDVPEKFRRYYKLLLELRSHITEGLNLHTEETLKRSAKDDAGDLSSYGQHMADAGTDTFDRDFALSLVSSEQEALTEIEAAIKRVHDGSYGVCEVTAKPIAKERLLAVPFTRYSAEAQKDIEKNRMRTRTAAGLFGEIGEDGVKMGDDDGGGGGGGGDE